MTNEALILTNGQHKGKSLIDVSSTDPEYVVSLHQRNQLKSDYDVVLVHLSAGKIIENLVADKEWDKLKKFRASFGKSLSSLLYLYGFLNDIPGVDKLPCINVTPDKILDVSYAKVIDELLVDK
jgi:hypothetical protein